MKVAVSMTRGLAFLHNELPATNSKVGGVRWHLPDGARLCGRRTVRRACGLDVGDLAGGRQRLLFERVMPVTVQRHTGKAVPSATRSGAVGCCMDDVEPTASAGTGDAVLVDDDGYLSR